MIKKINILLSALCLSISTGYNAQKKLNDPSIVAQGKRQVFERWGDWRPYPKYVLGIQTNFAYSTVWGMLSPRRNKRYKNGEDIRPLKANGIEVQRLGSVELQRKETERIKVEVDTLYKRNVQDFAHWTPTTAGADPLWLLYYKRMLRPLQEFPDKPQNFRQWGIKDDETYQMMLKTGTIESFQRDLDVLKDKYKQSRELAMPRGKRFLMYHECLLEWRRFKSQIADYSQKTNLLLDWRNTINRVKNTKAKTKKSDLEIMQEAINEYNNKLDEK